MSKRTSHLRKVPKGATVESKPSFNINDLSKEEINEIEQNAVIGRLYEQLKPKINDPLKLTIMVARIYGNACIKTFQEGQYRASKENVVIVED